MLLALYVIPGLFIRQHRVVYAVSIVYHSAVFDCKGSGFRNQGSGDEGLQFMGYVQMLIFWMYPHFLRSRAINNRPYTHNFIVLRRFAGWALTVTADFYPISLFQALLALFDYSQYYIR